MSIQIKNLTKFYGKQKALDNISFEVNTGEIVGFIGPNGAGKSTTMKIITGFIPASSGELYINGMSLAQKAIQIRREIGYLPEHNPLYLDMYVKEFLSYISGIYKVKNKKTRISEIIEQLGIKTEQHKKLGALSKGFRQRIGLAQALIHDPKILILDEPTSGLDPNQIIEIRSIISNIGKEKTVLLSTHIMQEVEAICDRIIIINKGKIVADDTTKNIQKHSIEKMQTILVEFDKQIIKEKLELIKGVTKVLAIKENNWAIQSKAEDDIRGNIFNFAVRNKLTVLSLQKQERTLEQIFQELTK